MSGRRASLLWWLLPLGVGLALALLLGTWWAWWPTPARFYTFL